MSDENPQVIIIAGPNGAGKTTLAPFLLRDRFQLSTFVNADAIATGLSAFEPESVALEAGRVMLSRLHELAQQKDSFAFETTLAARSYAPWIKDIRSNGYEVHLVFVSLHSAELAIERVTERVRRGGHGILPHEIRRRYERGIVNLFRLYIPIVDSWAIYDNSLPGRPLLIANGEATTGPRISKPEIWQGLIAQVGRSQ